MSLTAGLTMPEFRAVLATDLKVTIDSELTQAELNRSVQRAVDDVSRHLPLELAHEVTPDFTVTDESYTTPAAADTDSIVDNQTLNGVSSGGTLTLASQKPDVPRRLELTLTDANASVTSLTIIVKGYNQNGFYIEEAWYLKDLVSGTASQGNLYFIHVSEVEVDLIAGTAAADDVIDIGSSTASDSDIFLATKPIRPQSEEVTSDPSGTTYTRDTDYTIDYINGRIRFISGGDQVAGTAYLITYTKSRLGVDISSIIAEITRVQRVQYPSQIVPQQFVSFAITGDFLYIGSKQTNQSQEEMTTSKNDHLVIYYEKRHHPPGEGSPGSYPALLDEVVGIGAAGYALLILAQKHEQQAVLDLASLRLELAKTDTPHTNVGTALASAKTELGLANTALDNINVGAQPNLADANTALDKVIIALENNSSDDAKYYLGLVKVNIAELVTKIIVSNDAAATALGLVKTADLDAANDSATANLQEYEDKIDVLTVGANVAGLGADFSRAWQGIAAARTNQAIGYMQETQARIATLMTNIQTAAGYVELAMGWVAESNSRIAIADRFIAEGDGRIATALGYVQEAQMWLAKADRYLAEAQMYAEATNADTLLADRFRTEGLERLAEFHAIMKNKAEYRRRIASVPVHQPA